MYYQTPNSPATDFILEEEGGIRLILKDRFLPYRPITIGGKQRAEFTWYPGSPEATVQMLGPEENSIQLRGFWKDKFLQVGVSATTYDTVAAQRLSASALKLEGEFTSTAAVVQAVDNMRRMGRQITLKWSGLERVGHIVSFNQTWHNIHDCEWEIEFAVLSQGEKTVPAVDAVKTTLPDAYTLCYQQALKIQALIAKAPFLAEWVNIAIQTNLALEGAQLILATTAGGIGDVAQTYAGGVLSIAQGTRRAVSTLTGAISGLGTQYESIRDTAIAEAYVWGIYGDIDNAPPGAQIAAARYQRETGTFMRDVRYTFATERRQQAQVASDNAAQVQTYTPSANTDLRDISTQFYGSPDSWRALMEYNGLRNSQTVAGAPLAIPPASALQSGSNTRNNG